MNPNSGETGPQFEAPQANEGLEKQREKAMENMPDGESSVGKKTPKQQNSVAMQLPIDIPAAGPVAIPSDTDDDQTAAASPPGSQAHDSHRIERQWVDRAKRVIGQTKDDPHAQKSEMSKVKAEYIQKRFNKTIPTDDTAAA